MAPLAESSGSETLRGRRIEKALENAAMPMVELGEIVPGRGRANVFV